MNCIWWWTAYLWAVFDELCVWNISARSTKSTLDFESYVQYGKQNLVIFEKECNITYSVTLVAWPIYHIWATHTQITTTENQPKGWKTSIFAHRTTSILDHSHSQEALVFHKNACRYSQRHIPTVFGKSYMFFQPSTRTGKGEKSAEVVKNLYFRPFWPQQLCTVLGHSTATVLQNSWVQAYSTLSEVYSVLFAKTQDQI